MLAFVLLLGAGCSGINAGGSVSPAMFFIPGAKTDPPAAPLTPLAVAPASTQLAQVQN